MLKYIFRLQLFYWCFGWFQKNILFVLVLIEIRIRIKTRLWEQLGIQKKAWWLILINHHIPPYHKVSYLFNTFSLLWYESKILGSCKPIDFLKLSKLYFKPVLSNFYLKVETVNLSNIKNLFWSIIFFFTITHCLYCYLMHAI